MVAFIIALLVVWLIGLIPLTFAQGIAQLLRRL